MARKNLEQTTLEKYNESKSDAIPESILLRIKEWRWVLWVFFEKAFFKINTKQTLWNLKTAIQSSIKSVTDLRNVFKK